KMALAGTPVGGAKSVVIGDPATDKTPALLHALGRAVDKVGGRYIMGTDVGTNAADMERVGEVTDYVVGKNGLTGDTGPATAHGAWLGIRAAARYGLGRDDLAGLRVAVQGLGEVGRNLCKLLARDGVELLVADVDKRAVDVVVNELGAVAVSPDTILECDVDVVAPCALGDVLDSESIPRLRCSIVAGAANNQLSSPSDANLLRARGILYAPDFVINAGGVIGAQLGMGQASNTGYDFDTADEK